MKDFQYYHLLGWVVLVAANTSRTDWMIPVLYVFSIGCFVLGFFAQRKFDSLKDPQG